MNKIKSFFNLVVALILCACLAFSVACGTKDDAPDDNGDIQNSSQTQQSSTEDSSSNQTPDSSSSGDNTDTPPDIDPSECDGHKDVDRNGVCDLCESSVEVDISFVSINDLHGKLFDTDSQPGVDELTTYLLNEEESGYSVLLSSGDMWQGSSESNLTNGKMMTEWMNYVGFEAMTYGNHEFDWAKRYIYENMQLADFPFLAINIYDKQSGELADYATPSVIVERGGAKIGIIGAIGDCHSSISQDRVTDVEFILGDELTDLVKEESAKLKEEGCDFIVYSIHDSYSCYDEELSLGYVDLVFEGHTHSSYYFMDTYGVYHLQAGGENRGISQAEVTINFVTGEYEVTSAKTVDNSVYSRYESHSIVDTLAEKYASQIAKGDELLGTCDSNIKGRVLRQLCADLYLEKGLAVWSGYDIAIAGGYIGIRSPGYLSAGEVYYKNVYELFPFDNNLALCSISGEHLLSRFINNQNTNYFIAYSDYGNSILNDISADQTYYIVTDTYSAYYADNMLTIIELLDEEVYARDLISDFIRKGGYGEGNGSGGETCAHEETFEECVDATCTENGYKKVYCAYCKTILSEVIISAPGHNYENGECTVCGEKDGSGSGGSDELDIAGAKRLIDQNPDGVLLTFDGVVIGFDSMGYAHVADETGVIYIRAKATNLVKDAYVKISGTGFVYVGSESYPEYTRQIKGPVVVELASGTAPEIKGAQTLTASDLATKSESEDVSKEFHGNLVTITGTVSVGSTKYTYYLLDDEGKNLVALHHYSQFFNNDVTDEANSFNELNGKKITITGVIYRYYTAENIWSFQYIADSLDYTVADDGSGGETCAHEETFEECVDATCTENGYKKVYCAYCKTILSEVIISAPGHNYENGECTVCGEKDGSGSGEESAEIQLISAEIVTISDFLQGNYSAKYARLSGVVSEIIDDASGEFVLTDDSGNVTITGLYANVVSLKQPSLSELGIAVGDRIEICSELGDESSISQILGSYLIADLTISSTVTVSSASELNALIAQMNGGLVANDITISLGADIDMAGIDYQPITEFRGVFEGNGYTISNIELPLSGATISLTDGNWVDYTVVAIGFIASAYDATIRNLNLENVTAEFETEKQIFVGGMVGYSVGVAIYNCEISTEMYVVVSHESTGKDISGVAGVVGYSLGAYIENSKVNCVIDYSANSYEAFEGAVLGVGHVCVFNCEIILDQIFTGDRYGHTGYIIGMGRTPSGIVLACMYNSSVTGTMYIANDIGYAWGEVGQGWFCHFDGTRYEAEEYNDVDISING